MSLIKLGSSKVKSTHRVSMQLRTTGPNQTDGRLYVAYIQRLAEAAAAICFDYDSGWRPSIIYRKLIYIYIYI